MERKSEEEKDYRLTPEEGKRLCDETRASIELAMGMFPEVDKLNENREKSRFYQWVRDRNAKDRERGEGSET